MNTNASNTAHAKRKSAGKPMKIESHSSSDTYFGTIEQLVGTGNFQRRWFPGQAKNKGTVSRVKNVMFGDKESPLIHISRKTTASQRYRAIVHLGLIDSMIRRFPEEKAIARAKSMKAASSWLRTMAKSGQEFVAFNLYSLKSAIGTNISWCQAKDGFAFSADSISRFESAIESLCNDVRCYPVEFSQSEHDDKRRKLAEDAFESQGMGRLLDSHSYLLKDLGIDRDAEKAVFVTEALALPVAGYQSAVIDRARMSPKEIRALIEQKVLA